MEGEVRGRQGARKGDEGGGRRQGVRKGDEGGGEGGGRG